MPSAPCLTSRKLFLAVASYISYIPALGWLFLGLAVVLTAYALFADRAKGRRRCPKCWYDMAGLPGPQCPECGHAARNDRALSRTRRRWKRLVFTVPLAIIGYAGIVGPGVLSDGARAIVPNALVALWPLDPRLLVEPDLVPEPTGRVNRFMFKELNRRIDEHRFADWQFDVITGRIRHEYTRLGRYGVSEEEQAILEKLASTPFVPEMEPANLADLVRALGSAGVPYQCDIQSDDMAECILDIADAHPTLLHGLDRIAVEADVDWTIQNGQIYLSDLLKVSALSKVAIFNVCEIAPTSPYVHRTDTRVSLAVDDSLPRALVDALNQATQWPGPFRSGGLFPPCSPVGGHIVVRMHPQQIMQIESLLGMLRAAESAGPYTCMRAARRLGPTLTIDHGPLRVFNLTGSMPRVGPKPDDLSPTDLAWHIARRKWEDLQSELVTNATTVIEDPSSEVPLFQWPHIINGLLIVFGDAQQRDAQAILNEHGIDLSTYNMCEFDLSTLNTIHPPTK